MTPIVAVAAATLVMSFLCSLFEAALYSITPARVEVLRARGDRGAARLERLRADVEAPIAAILTINTIAHTIGAAWCGAMVGERYGNRAVGVFAAVFTVLVLALTEIVPKSAGVRYAAVLGPRIVWPLQLMIWSVWPVVQVSRWAIRRIAGVGGAGGPTEEEVVGVSRLALRGGELRQEEHRWVRGALELDKATAGDLRTPRTVVETLPADTPLAEIADLGPHWVHSRVPLTEGEDVDRVVGVVHRREVFDAVLARPDDSAPLRTLMRPLPFVPETMPAHELLAVFLDGREHMAAVVDEYGGFEGVVTLEDVLERLLGREIVDEHDRFEDLRALAAERAARRRGPDA